MLPAVVNHGEAQGMKAAGQSNGEGVNLVVVLQDSEETASQRSCRRISRPKEQQEQRAGIL